MSFYITNKIRVPALSDPIETLVHVICIKMFLDSYSLFGMAFASAIVFFLTYIVFAYYLWGYLPTLPTSLAFIKLFIYSITLLAVLYNADLSLNALSMPYMLHTLIVFATGMPLNSSAMYITKDRELNYIPVIARKQSKT